MISHVPGPFERMIRRFRDRVGEWMDSLCAKSEAAQPVAHEIKSQPPKPQESPPPAPPVMRVAHPVSTGNVAAHEARNTKADQKAAHARERDLLMKIAKAIEDGRATGSQRQISRTFNVSRATVQRAQKLVREAA